MEFIPARCSPPAPVRSRGELPHLYKQGGTYFVTFRLADAVLPPAERVRRAGHGTEPPDDSDPTLSIAAYEPPLTLGSCALGDPRVAALVRQAMLHFGRSRYELLAWCVMPNHVHAVLTPLAGYAPDPILHSWKSYTAHAANRVLGRSGTFW